ncbi:ABC transporter substrate-binding protein [Vogesella sp. LIG4]|uniref:substrate-binding periplasmic protein n=1 Tax=Vogesella sp. LIG4 TaxID=1192162 RepID=UPI00081F78BE|nr:transporter substrate-binding domain-containing protein [Vogesella sp. LIG4]SCK23366.1 polar amino acid transport system substrate-binding protein [Vogesella sp. LIG4]
MRIFKRLLPYHLHALLAVAGLLACQQAIASVPCARLVASGNPEYPPYLWVDPNDDKRLIGAAADMMQMLSREVGIPISINYGGPWARVQKSVRDGRIDLIAGAFFTQPRRQYMSYIQTPLTITRTAIWMRDSKPFNYTRWLDLVGYRGVTVVNNSFGEEFDRFAEHSLNIETVGSVENALRMLSMGRADYLIYEDAPAQAYANRLGLQNLKTASGTITREPLYLTLGHQSSCFSDELYQRLNKAMKKLVDSKVMEQLIEKNQQRWREEGN